MSFFNRGLFAILAIIITGGIGCSKSASKDTVATVGDSGITASEFKGSLATLPPQWRARAKTPSGKKQILEHQIRAKLIELEAKDRGIDSRPQVKYQIDQAVQRILLQELMKEWQKEFEIPDAELKEYFEQHKDQYQQGEKFRAQHILIKVAENASRSVADKAKAKAVAAKKRVLKGEPFEKVAREVSEGPSAAKGGDLGYVEHGRFNEKFEAAARKLKPGEISNPVRTPFGWHIIKLIDVKEASGKSFDEVKDRIKQQLMPRKRQQAFEAFMTNLKTKYSVSVNDDLLSKLDTTAKPATSK